MKILGFAGSVRAGSLNVGLCRAALDLARERGHDTEYLDLGRYPLPLYHGDFEDLHGVPVTAEALCRELGTADGLLIAGPEYNGGPSGLLKNTIDWITRVDMVAFQSARIGLMSATPGSKGGRHGLDITAAIFEWMKCTLHEPFSLPKATPELSDEAHSQLDAWVASFVAELDEAD